MGPGMDPLGAVLVEDEMAEGTAKYCDDMPGTWSRDSVDNKILQYIAYVKSPAVGADASGGPNGTSSPFFLACFAVNRPTRAFSGDGSGLERTKTSETHFLKWAGDANTLLGAAEDSKQPDSATILPRLCLDSAPALPRFCLLLPRPLLYLLCHCIHRCR